MRALVLDFDGVISDSGPEVFVNALGTYAGLRPESPLARRPECGERAIDPASLGSDPLYRAFVQIMPLGNRAEDFGVALAALDLGVALADQDAYDAHYLAVEREQPGFLAAFHARFYEERRARQQRDAEGWARLCGPYRAFTELLARRRHDVELAIATAKDRESVRILLHNYGIDRLFPDDRLLDKEVAVNKRVHLERLAERLALPFEQITFLDDKVNHLDRVSDLGVRCGLAAWGYNTGREIELARARGYLVCGLDDVEAQLFPASQ